MLSGGRFDFGIGTGRPDARAAAESFGRPWGTGAERLAAVKNSITALRELDGDQQTPVMIAAGGPRAMELAATDADIVALAATPTTPRDDVTPMAAGLRERAGDRAEDIELAMNLFIVGDDVPPWARQYIGADRAELYQQNSLGVLRGTAQQMADELYRRRTRSMSPTTPSTTASSTPWPPSSSCSPGVREELCPVGAKYRGRTSYREYTAVGSIATCVTAAPACQSSRSSRPGVVAPKVGSAGPACPFSHTEIDSGTATADLQIRSSRRAGLWVQQ